MPKRPTNSNDPAGLPNRILATREGRGLTGLLLEEPLVVGVSGGADSLALLHILLALRTEKARQLLHVGHLEHGFRGSDSADDAKFVASICREWGVRFTTTSVDVPGYAAKRKLSPEDAARRARYAFLGALAAEHSATIAVAHSADDQAETVLMNIVRGTGISGLAGMRWLAQAPLPGDDPELADLVAQALSTPPSLFRPLLGTWRVEIEEYCQLHSLSPRHDETNLDMAYMRNKVRHELIPLLSERYNRAAKLHLWQLAEVARSEDDAMEARVTNLWPQLIDGSAHPGVLSLHPQPLIEEPEAVRRRVARRALLEVAGTLEGFELGHIEMLSDLLVARAGGVGAVDLPNGISAMRKADVVYLWNRELVDLRMGATDNSTWPLMQPDSIQHITPMSQVELTEGWRLAISVDRPGPLALSDDNLSAQFDLAALDDTSRIAIRTRKAGDHIVPFGMRGTQSLQDLFVDAKIPRDVRDRLPLLAFHESSDILWVPGPGGRRSVHAPVTGATERVIQFRFERDPMPKGEV